MCPRIVRPVSTSPIVAQAGDVLCSGAGRSPGPFSLQVSPRLRIKSGAQLALPLPVGVERSRDTLAPSPSTLLGTNGGFTFLIPLIPLIPLILAILIPHPPQRALGAAHLDCDG
jgi:hypothetical protein